VTGWWNPRRHLTRLTGGGDSEPIYTPCVTAYPRRPATALLTTPWAGVPRTPGRPGYRHCRPATRPAAYARSAQVDNQSPDSMPGLKVDDTELAH
jgi:hypothetical protein